MTVELSKFRVLVQDPVSGVVAIDTLKQLPNVVYEATMLNRVTIDPITGAQMSSLYYVNNVPILDGAQKGRSKSDNIALLPASVVANTTPLMWVRVSNATNNPVVAPLAGLGWIFVPGTLPLEYYQLSTVINDTARPFYGMMNISVEPVLSSGRTAIRVITDNYIAYNVMTSNRLNSVVQNHPMTNVVNLTNGDFSFDLLNTGVVLDVHLKIIVENK